MTAKKEENKRMMEEVYQKREVMKKSPITIEQYREYKDKGLADTKIMEKVGMHNAAFNEWKRAAGLIQKTEKTKKKQAPEEKAVAKSETPKTEKSEVESLKEQVKQLETGNYWYGKYQELEKSHAKELEKLKTPHDHINIQETHISEDAVLEIKTLREELDAMQSKYGKTLDERDDLRLKLSELEETELIELKQAQAYQQQGEQAYRLLKSEYDELQRQVNSLRDAEELSVALARRYVLLSGEVEL